MIAVRAARDDDRDEIVRLIDLAFFDLDANQYLVPESADRSAVMRRYFAIHVGHALDKGLLAQVATDGADGAVVGAALWYHSDDPGPEDYDDRTAAAVGPDRVQRFARFDHLLHEHTPETPHAYLGFLAVTPDRQGRGIGGRLLREHHERLDAQQQPAYLVASSAASARLYERHGYRPLEPLERHLLGLPNGRSMYRMWRAPQGG